MKKAYIQPQNFVVNLSAESLLTSMSVNSNKTTDAIWTNKMEYTDEEPFEPPFWVGCSKSRKNPARFLTK